MDYATDAYVRLAPGEAAFSDVKLYGALETSQFLFVDVGPHALITALRNAPIRTGHGERTIIVRCEKDSFAEVVDILDRLPIGAYRLARLDQEPGEPNRLLTLTSPRTSVSGTSLISRLLSKVGFRRNTNDDPQETPVTWAEAESLLARARAVELRALLNWSDAIWEPNNFHFELPSGLHADIFVRMSDAISTQRDAHVIATWLTPDMRDGLGIVADTSTLAAVIASMETLMQEKGWKLGPIVTLDHYPRTDLDAIAAVVNANEAGHVLGLISVSASGRLRDRLWAALETQAARLDHSVLHILLDTTQPVPIPGIRQWLPLPGEEPMVRPSVQAGRCAHCLDSTRAPIARIVGPSFRPLLPSDKILLMPDPRDAATNRRFWEMCDAVGGIGLEEKPAVALFRQPQLRMNIRIRFEKLVQSTHFLETLAERVREQNVATMCDLVLVPEGEHDLEGFDGVWNTVAPLLSTASEPKVFPVDREWDSQSLLDAVRDAHEIMIFGLGAVTGSTLQRGLTGVQHLRDDWQYRTRGLVVHARPATIREWETLNNAFAGQLTALWQTFIPQRSPLADEADALEDLDTSVLDSSVEDLVEVRKKLCNGALTVDEVPLFLATSLDQRVTPHSIFGQRIGAPTVYTAVASAIAARFAAIEKTAPARHARFEMPALVRSYYDPLILVSALRWLRPHEMYWGDDPQGAERVVAEMLSRAEHTDLNWELVLVSELGLAAAQGKVPRPGVEHVYSRALSLIDDVDDSARAPLLLALALIERTHPIWSP